MPFFVDVAAVRIQAWLSRTPSLRGRRGASSLLSVSTSAEAVAPLLPADCRMNDEAGDVDGVVSLTADSPAAAERGSRMVAAHLRDRMPAIEVNVSPVVDALDYLTAYPRLHEHPGTLWQPAAPEVTFALPCAYCGHDPATRSGDLSPDRRDQPVCNDCHGRLEHAGFSSSTTDKRSPRDQIRVRQWLESAGGAPERFPEHFESLAELDPGSTHVATVFCDGNRVGLLFQALASSGAMSKRDLAKGIDDATTTALSSAIQRISRDGDRCLPVSPHLVGGDDLLVTVPARRGWAFTLEYLSSFGQALDRWRRDAGLEAVTDSPTASAGVVFHHHSYPFPQVVETAERALKESKAEFRGQQAAVAWADITADDTRVHGPRSVTWLNDHRRTLDELARTGASQRAVLARIQQAEIPDQVRRLGLSAAKALFDEDIITLRDGLSIVKWRQADE